jgi:DNA-binding protein YbaB
LSGKEETKNKKVQVKTGNDVITALTAGSKMLPTICIDQSSTGSTVQRRMERMIAVALTSTASLDSGEVLETMMDSVLQRKKEGLRTSKDLMSPGVASIDLSWNQAPLLLEQRRKERNSIIEKDYHGLIERIKCLHIFSSVVEQSMHATPTFTVKML